MSPLPSAVIHRFDPIDLATLDRRAALQTRKDRKYVVDGATLVALLEALPADVRMLEIDGQRWFHYRSVYFDTPRHDSYRQAATRRPRRFKIRARTYLDSGRTLLEVKTKDRRGRTVKHRRKVRHGWDDDAVVEAAREYATGFVETSPYADDLVARLTSRYRRATFVPTDGGRVTVDADYECIDADGASTGLRDRFIVETKTPGPPCLVDRLLWRSGHRPVKLSKYATGLAALHPELPANRWHPVLRAQFGRSPASRTLTHVAASTGPPHR